MKKMVAFLLCAALMLVAAPRVTADGIPDDYSEDLPSIATGVGADTPFEVTAKSVVLMEKSTGRIILAKNETEKLAMASVTKIMTLLLIFEAIDDGLIDMDSVVTVSEYAAGMGGSQAYLEPGEQMSVHDMLKCIVVSSCNDAAVAMAEKVSGNIDAFVAAMNEKAAALSLKNTHFVNCTGLDADGHYSCAEDIAVMSRELMRHGKIFEYTTIWMDTVRNGEFGLSNTNKLLKVYTGMTGLKTGSTDNALFCISATAKRENTEFIAVVLGAPTSKDRFSDAAKLLDYGFANYKVVTYMLPQLPRVAVEGGMAESVAVKAEKESVSVLVKKSDKAQITSEISLPDAIKAPVRAGEEVGSAVYKLGEGIIEKTPIVAAENVAGKGYFEFLYELLKQIFMMRQL